MAIRIIRYFEDDTKELISYSDTGVFERAQSIKSLADVHIDPADKCMVLIPGVDVSMQTLTLPNMSLSELQQAVPNSLEEQLSDDIQQLYFAIGDADSMGQRHIAVIDKHKWETLLAELKAHNLAPELIIPDFLALPIRDDAWTIFYGQQTALLRLNTQDGFSCDTALLSTLIELKLKESPTAPDRVDLICEPGIKHDSLPLTSSAHSQTQTFGQALRPHELLEQATFTMLQKSLRKKRRTSSKRSYWYWCGVSFVSLIAVFFLGQVALYIDLKITSHNLNTKILATYQRIFPDSTQVVEPKFRVSEQLKAYALTPNPFITIVDRIGKVKQKSSARLQSLNYANNKATLVIRATTNAELNQFNQQLAQVGLKIISNQTNTVNKQINETLVVEVA